MSTSNRPILFPVKKITSFKDQSSRTKEKENSSLLLNRSPVKSPEKASRRAVKSKRNDIVAEESAECSPRKSKSPSPVKQEQPDCESPQKLTDSLSSAIQALHSSLPSSLPGRDSQIATICSFLRSHLKEKRSTSMYVSGPPGTGKTACLNHIIALPEFSSAFEVVYVNCTGMRSSVGVYKKICSELKIKVTTTERAAEKSIINYLKSPHKMILLVLDEIDQLESKKQSILYSIFEWPSIPGSNLILVGIANALDLTDRVLPRLQARVELQPKLLHFSPYTKNEIIDILTERLSDSNVGEAFSSAALQLLAAKVAAVSGDIRKALDVSRRVIELVQDSHKSGKKASLQEVLSVVNNVYSTADSLMGNNDESESLPLQQRLLICTTILIRKNSKTKDLTVGKIYDTYKKVCKNRNLGEVDLSEFLALAELIESRGVIRIAGKTKNRLSKVNLQWDETEVLNAFKDKQLLSTVLNDLSCLS